MSQVCTMTKLVLPADTDREVFWDLVTKRLNCMQLSNHSQNRRKYNRSIDILSAYNQLQKNANLVNY